MSMLRVIIVVGLIVLDAEWAETIIDGLLRSLQFKSHYRYQ